MDLHVLLESTRQEIKVTASKTESACPHFLSRSEGQRRERRKAVSKVQPWVGVSMLTLVLILKMPPVAGTLYTCSGMQVSRGQGLGLLP